MHLEAPSAKRITVYTARRNRSVQRRTRGQVVPAPCVRDRSGSLRGQGHCAAPPSPGESRKSQAAEAALGREDAAGRGAGGLRVSRTRPSLCKPGRDWEAAPEGAEPWDQRPPHPRLGARTPPAAASAPPAPRAPRAPQSSAPAGERRQERSLTCGRGARTSAAGVRLWPRRPARGRRWSGDGLPRRRPRGCGARAGAHCAGAQREGGRGPACRQPRALPPPLRPAQPMEAGQARSPPSPGRPAPGQPPARARGESDRAAKSWGPRGRSPGEPQLGGGCGAVNFYVQRGKVGVCVQFHWDRSPQAKASRFC